MVHLLYPAMTTDKALFMHVTVFIVISSVQSIGIEVAKQYLSLHYS